ncbi:protein of unknown function [Candidatus Promineifilum breve]|uniref:Transposase n=1 Tax=Candidatus Promineifilum breve TaxID=1806508 RepID=A0A170PK08_9CHLR|nr:hypothetical protein [Candidatus Promineifilum breve]CUS06227.1 protein of unknown function [Candidatus Promineifilum breve]
MAVHVEQMTTEVVTAGGDLPLTEAQIERLVQLILRRLAEKERETRYSREANAIRTGVAPGGPVGR